METSRCKQLGKTGRRELWHIAKGNLSCNLGIQHLHSRLVALVKMNHLSNWTKRILTRHWQLEKNALFYSNPWLLCLAQSSTKADKLSAVLRQQRVFGSSAELSWKRKGQSLAMFLLHIPDKEILLAPLSLSLQKVCKSFRSLISPSSLIWFSVWSERKVRSPMTSSKGLPVLVGAKSGEGEDKPTHTHTPVLSLSLSLPLKWQRAKEKQQLNFDIISFPNLMNSTCTSQVATTRLLILSLWVL